MTFVSNASPLINLARIGQIELLQEQLLSYRNLRDPEW